MLTIRVAAGATSVVALLIAIGIRSDELPASAPAADLEAAILPVAGAVEIAGRATLDVAAKAAKGIEARQALIAGDHADSGEDPGLDRLREEIEDAGLDDGERRGFLARLADEGDTAIGRALLLADLRAAILD